RWVHAVTLAILAAMAAGMLSTGTLNWVVALFLALVALQALNTVVLWRWRVHTDESGVTIQRGIGQPRTLGWASITAVRRGLPPRIEVADGPDVSLGAGISRRLLTRAAAHIHAHAARRR